MQAIWIIVLIITGAIIVPIWLYFVAYMITTARLNAHRDWRRDNGGK